MTGIRDKDGRVFGFENEAEVNELIAALPGNGDLGERVLSFEPGGCWCVNGPDGKALKRDDGRYVTVSLSDQAVQRYWRAREAVDRGAVNALRNHFSTHTPAGIKATGSTGADWFDETD